VCINQADDAERTAQFARMRDLYSAAWSVFSWLGGTGAVDRHNVGGYGDAFDLLGRLAELEGESEKAAFARRMTDARQDDADEEMDRMRRGAFGLARWSLSQSYFTRLWIVQEVVLGGSAVTVRLGDRSLGWRALARAVNVMSAEDMFNTIEVLRSAA